MFMTSYTGTKRIESRIERISNIRKKLITEGMSSEEKRKSCLVLLLQSFDVFINLTTTICDQNQLAKMEPVFEELISILETLND